MSINLNAEPTDEPARFTLNDGMTVKGTGNASIDYVTFVRSGKVVGTLKATLHFSDLAPELHGLALQCLRTTTLHIGPGEGPQPAAPLDGPASYRAAPRTPAVQALRERAVTPRPWWKFW
jgi:hypothetical protein